MARRCSCSCSKVSDAVWAVNLVMVVVAVAAIAVPRTLSVVLDVEDTNDNVSNKAEQPRETANQWADRFSRIWAYNQEGVANLINKAKHTTSDGLEYLSEKADAAVSDDSTLSGSAKDMVVEYYNEANKKVEEAYDMVVKNGFSAEAKAKYEAVKEKASDAAGEVGAMMRH